jgi:hypothetical protein
MRAELFERLEDWRVTQRSNDPDAERYEITRTAAIEHLLEVALNSLETKVPASAAEVLSSEIRGVDATFGSVGADLVRRMDLIVALLDRMGPATIAVPTIIANWMSKDSDVRGYRETQQQAEERIVEEMEALSDAIWAQRRREIVPSEEDLALPVGDPDDDELDPGPDGPQDLGA